MAVSEVSEEHVREVIVQNAVSNVFEELVPRVF